MKIVQLYLPVMLRGGLLIITGIFMTSLSARSQAKPDTLFTTLQSRGEVYVAMKSDRLKNTRYLPPGVAIDRVSGDSVFLYFHPQDTAYLRRCRNDIILLRPPSERIIPHMASGTDDVLDGTAYPTWDQYLSIMSGFASRWPEICTIDTIGFSVRGKPLLAAFLNKGNYQTGDVPLIFLTSGIHGDEVTGYSLMLRLIDFLLSGQGPAQTGNLLQNRIIVINPLANPDGTYHMSDTSVYGAIRGNAHLVDLNRNFPDLNEGDHPDFKAWQPETRSMMEYMEQNHPDMSANFHGGAEVFNYPFDTWAARHADDDWFRFIGREYADTAHLIDPAYMSDLHDGVTNGFDWYQVSGGRQDYVTWFLHGREVTIELSHNKMPPAVELDNYWERNRRSLLNFIKESGYGVEGYVHDTMTGEALREATIYIPDHDTLHSSVFSGSSGKFFRYLDEGEYQLSVRAEGYQTLDSIYVRTGHYRRSFIDAALLPLNETYSYSARVSPNPFTNRFNLVITSPEEEYLFSRIYDLRGMLLDNRFFLMKKGVNNFTVHPRLPAPGFYLLVLSAGNFRKELKIVRMLER